MNFCLNSARFVVVGQGGGTSWHEPGGIYPLHRTSGYSFFPHDGR